MKIKLSKSQWEHIGKIAGWQSIDPSELDSDVGGGFYDADSEEEALLGPEDPEESPEVRLISAYKEGYAHGIKGKQEGNNSTVDCPWGHHSEFANQLSRKWFDGFGDAWNDRPSIY